ncbi:cytochrome P450 [Usnea florida]
MAFPLAIPWIVFVACLVSYVIYLATVILYNIFFHPLRHFPGPVFWTSNRLPWAWNVFFGNLPRAVSKLHARYGDVVRVAPDELSLIDPSAWKDIMAAHKGRPLMQKDPLALIRSTTNAESIINVVSDGEHSRMRRVLAHAFSEKAMREQEPLIQEYIDLFMKSLHTAAAKGPQNMVSWYEFIAFDIIGDLTFGQSLKCISNGNSQWITFMNVIFKAGKRISVFKYFPHLAPIMLPLMTRSKAYKSRMKSVANTRAMVSRRMATKTDRKDFMSYALRAMEKGDPGTMMSNEEIMTTFEVLMVAGSETTATTLSGVTYHLLKNPAVLKKLVAETRSTFTHSHEITMLTVPTLKYQLAVLEESLRIMPPVANALVRLVPPGTGETVGTHFVPGGTKVGIPSWAACHSPFNFRDPESFIPERWLGDARYASDRREASQPFSIGPRGCIGRNLAYAEIRIVLARLLLDFDMEIAEGAEGWLAGLKNFTLWQKEPLMVRLRAVGKG